MKFGSHIYFCKIKVQEIEDKIDQISEEYDNLCIEYWKWIGAKEYLEKIKNDYSDNSSDSSENSIKSSENDKIPLLKNFI